MYDLLTNVPQNAAEIPATNGSYDGAAFNKIQRISGSSRVLVAQQTHLPQSGSNRNYYVYVTHITIPEGSNYLEALMQYTSLSTNDSYVLLVKNPLASAIGNHQATSVGGVTIGYVTARKSTPTNWNTTHSVSPGDVVAVFCKGYYGGTPGDEDNYYSTVRNIYLNAYSPIAGPGVILGYNDGTYGAIRPNEYRATPFSISSPNTINSENIKYYKKGDDLFNHIEVQNLVSGTVYPASGTITIRNIDDTSDNVYTVQSIRRDANGVTVGTTVGEGAILKWFGVPSAIGLYRKISASIIKIGQLRSIRASSILPKTNGDGNDNHMVGSGTEPFIAGHFTNLYAAGRLISVNGTDGVGVINFKTT